MYLHWRLKLKSFPVRSAMALRQWDAPTKCWAVLCWNLLRRQNAEMFCQIWLRQRGTNGSDESYSQKQCQGNWQGWWVSLDRGLVRGSDSGDQAGSLCMWRYEHRSNPCYQCQQRGCKRVACTHAHWEVSACTMRIRLERNNGRQFAVTTKTPVTSASDLQSPAHFQVINLFTVFNPLRKNILPFWPSLHLR